MRAMMRQLARRRSGLAAHPVTRPRRARTGSAPRSPECSVAVPGVNTAYALLGSLLACTVLCGCVTLQPVKDAPTPPPPDATDISSITEKQAFQRLSLIRPLEGGIEVPWLHVLIHGYGMVDAADYSDSSAFGGANITLRRADVNFTKYLWREWLFYADSQLVDWSLEFKDVYLRRQTRHFGRVTIGNQSEPFGLEQYGSFKNTTFLEVAMSQVIAPSRSVGISSSDLHGPWRWTYGFFTAGTKDENRVAGGAALTGRLAYVWQLPDSLYHFALDYSYRKHGSLRFNTSSEVALSHKYLLDTGKLTGTNDVTRRGLEIAHVNGPFSWQAEYMDAIVGRDAGTPRLHFFGWYALASWMLTGESRPYEDARAIFGQVIPHNPWNGRGGGALEVAVRLSQTDLNDQDVVGGKETNLTLGINWYLDSQLRISANFVQALDIDKPGSPYDGRHPAALVGRLQYQF